MSLVEILPSLVAAQKYEEKRQQYLAAKRGSIPDEPRVRFQESHPQGAPAATGPSPVVEGAPFLAEARHDSTKPQSYEQRVPANEPPPRADNQGTGGVGVDDRTERRDEAKLQPQDPAIAQSPGQRWPIDQDALLHEQTPATVVAQYPNADYARQPHEQMVADFAAAQRAREIERHPTAPSTTTLPANGQSILHAHEAAAFNRKAEYARQLREQMAADQAMKFALESERKRSAAPASSGGSVPADGSDKQRARGGVSVQASGSDRNSKAEYAQQLREQMEAKENAQRAAKGRRELSPSSHAGPSWIEGATEGREARRRQSNAEYAEQLRAQITAQKSINQAEQTPVASRLEPAKDWYRQARHEYRQEQQQWPGSAGLKEGWRTSDRQQSSSGEQTPSLSQGEAHNPLALERWGIHFQCFRPPTIRKIWCRNVLLVGLASLATDACQPQLHRNVSAIRTTRKTRLKRDTLLIHLTPGKIAPLPRLALILFP